MTEKPLPPLPPLSPQHTRRLPLPLPPRPLQDDQHTERNPRGRSVVWLTQSGSDASGREREAQWSGQGESRQQQAGEVEELLHQHHLMEAFEAFEHLRTVIADQLYSPKTYPFALLQAIEALKAKLSAQPPQEPEPARQGQLKELLQTIAHLRCENARLKERMAGMEGGGEWSNSILNNSLSFHEADTLSSSELSFEVTLQKELVRPFLSCEPVGSALQGEAEGPAHCVHSFLVTSAHQEAQTERGEEGSVEAMFGWLVEAVNLALIRDRARLNQFALLLQSAQGREEGWLLRAGERMGELVRGCLHDLPTVPL